MTVQALLFDALVLGVRGLAAWLALGDLLSIALFHSNPGYLSFAFPVGSQRIVTWQSVALAVGGGLLAACVGVLIPLRATSSSRPLRGGHGARRAHRRDSAARWTAAAAGASAWRSRRVILLAGAAGGGRSAS